MHTEIELLEIAQDAATLAWAKFLRLYPKLATYTMPKIIFNRRLKTTAGRCDYNTNIVDLSPSLMAENIEEFKNNTIPHELAHAVAYIQYGDTGHGPNWKSVMRAFGIPDERCHNMTSAETRAKAEIKEIKLNRTLAEDFRIGDKVTFVHTNRQREKRNVYCTVIRINEKSYGLVENANGSKWNVPKLNTCNLRII